MSIWMHPVAKLEHWDNVDASGDEGWSLDALVDDIARVGIQNPLEVVLHQGKVYVVNGQHRLAAARKLGLALVPVTDDPIRFGEYDNDEDWEPVPLRMRATS